ncbi:hypothetical protein [Afifella sp. YEN Y35]|uniref:hypothetical protein n=1 Tax=Afifella sp. YEN Y35 TaxID=3388337 RepID=UPI0039E1C222
MVSSPPVAQDDTNLQRQLAKLGEEVLAEDVPERLLQALTGAAQAPEDASDAMAGDGAGTSADYSPFRTTKRED